MRIQCSQESLLQEVQIANRAISSRASMPILGNILLDSMGETLKLAATDLELDVFTRNTRPGVSLAHVDLDRCGGKVRHDFSKDSCRKGNTARFCNGRGDSRFDSKLQIRSRNFKRFARGVK